MSFPEGAFLAGDYGLPRPPDDHYFRVSPSGFADQPIRLELRRFTWYGSRLFRRVYLRNDIDLIARAAREMVALCEADRSDPAIPYGIYI